MHTLLFTAAGERPSQPAAERGEWPSQPATLLLSSRNGDAQHVKGPPEEQVLTMDRCCRVVVVQVHPQAVLPLLLLLFAFVTQAGVASAGGVVA